jgi:hypothetical protein
MAGAVPHERLRGYLQELGPQARAMLLAELERSHLLGNELPGVDLILRALLPETEDAPRAMRTHPQARLFFAPLEPFLFDAGTARRRLGRVERSALVPIWQWIGRDVAPDATRTFESDVAAAMTARDSARMASLTRAFQDEIAYALGAIIAGVPQEERARRRLAGQVGTADAFRDLHILHTVLTHRDTLAALAERIPANIYLLEGELLRSVYAAVRVTVAAHPALLSPALGLVMNRLTIPWHLIRLTVASAQSGVGLVQSPLAYAVTFVLSYLASVAEELRAALKAGRFAHAAVLLKRLHDSIRGIRTELDLSRASAWARELAALLGEVSDILQSEIETVPGRVRRLMRPRKASEIRPESTLDPVEVQETQAQIAFVGVCRNYASELAINHPASHAHSTLKSLVDAGMPALVDALRGTGATERSFRQSQIDAAISFAEVLFGPDYAAAVAKAAALSAQSGNSPTSRAS